ncbi:SusC/RagA family TonB-linked outer membrane protein [Tamlana sp. s12]|uniref:SusC/RagA family TonB-linked outer membrane protein n=1 Tax=Tamlana sp. s12 TaxID=1630406 RepID=UPI0009EE9E66|nr:SusC/RagA family TonB-linked outer membrane protein [Tamlana sp. s12]QQY83752.1 SusC/RagA family TonB-linked outer membrane protein [Tamlana sp. s12]
MKKNITNILLFPKKRFLSFIMKLFIFLFSISVFSLSPKSGFSQNSKIKIKNDQVVSVDQVFKLIKDQTDYSFMYRVCLFENYPNISLKQGVFQADKLLDMALSKGKFEYEFSKEKTILIKKKEPKIEEIPNKFNFFQNRVTITGTVIDELEEPLAGVSVLVKGTNFGTYTDFDGKYSIDFDENSEPTVLVFVSMGYKKEEITVDSKKVINIKMTTSLDNLDEVVVIGYGTSSIKDVTGSISSISAKQVEEAPMLATVQSLLQGRAAGVNVQIASASPTSDISIIIRGQSSLSGDNQPLWVIDGVPQYSETSSGGVNNPLSNLNLDDVQSIDILKDASATAVYGSRAANGVVMVTTKKGKYNQKPIIELSTRVGLTVMDFNESQYFGVDDYKRFMIAASKESVLTSGFNDYNSAFIDENAFLNLNTTQYDASDLQVSPGAFYDNDINWQDEMTQNPFVMQHNFAIRGGSSGSTYSASFNYNDAEGVIKGGDSELFGGRFNFNTKISERFKFGLNVNASKRTTNNKDGLLTTLKYVRPDLPEYNPDGSIFTADIYTENPLTSLKNTNAGKGILFNGTTSLDYDILEGLTLRGAFTHNYFDTESLTYQRIGTSNNNPNNTRSLYRLNSSFNILEGTLSYKLVKNKHDISALAGYSSENRNNGTLYIYAEDFPDDEVLNNFTSAAEIVRLTEEFTENALISQFARLHYKFDDRYIISGTVRRDGSSRFGPDKRWGVFPSGAAAWIISEENFMKSSNIKKYVSFLKLRSSIGVTGSQNLGNFDWVTLTSTSTYDDSSTINPSTIGNPTLQWEQTQMLDLGLDFGLFDHRLSGSLGVYEKISDNLFYDQPIPLSSSFETIKANVASISNKGFEFDINYNIINTKDSRLTFNFNFSKNVTKVLKINGTIDELFFPGSWAPYVRLTEGGETGQWYGLQTSGRFYVNAEDMYAMRGNSTETGQTTYLSTAPETVGDLMFMDQDGDGVITNDDRVNLGSSTPLGYGGFAFAYQYKGFNVNANFTYAYGHKRFWNLTYTDIANTRHYNQSNVIAGESTILNNPYDALFPRLGPGMAQNARFSDFFLYDASYVRLTALNASYKIPSITFANTSIKGVELTFQATNLFTITKYPGFDPQGNFSSSAVGSGMSVDSSRYPAAQIYSLGLIFQFQ